MKPIDLFHLGPQKAGTTWVYRCFAEHPGVAVPPRDSIHYFDMHFARGESWYAEHFAGARPGQVLLDPTPSTLRCPWAPRRIAVHNPAARLVVCLRDPIERAFSHYWHEKKKRRIDYRFEEVLENYDLFASWLEPGFYAEHMERFLAHFPREQILVQRFEDLATDPAGFLRELLTFAGVDETFRPSVLETKVNAAGARRDAVSMGLHAVQRGFDAVGLHAAARWCRATPRLSGRREYDEGLDPALGAALLEICAPEIRRTEALTGLDLSDWGVTPAPPALPAPSPAAEAA